MITHNLQWGQRNFDFNYWQ